MNDEAASHYTAMLEQNGLGLQWLRHHFGECGRPHGAWQIDPFGHSKTQAELFALMGYDSVFFARMDYQEYNHRSKNRAIEMIWRGNDDFPQSRDLFTGGLVDTSYGPPGGFWFEGFSVDPIIDNEDSDEYNLPQRLDDFIKQIHHYQDQTHPGNIMFTMGSDFAYYNSIMYFKNMDKIIYHMNRLHGDKYHVLYSTPACYTKARNEAEQKWTVKSDDFMPYSNGPQGQYWSGYFTSRPGFKGYVWDTNPVLQMCHHMNLRGGHALGNHGDQAEFKLASAFGVGQHHDGISGTEQEHVTSDYTRQLHRGRTACRDIANRVLEKNFETPQGAINCEYRNVSICDETETAKEFTVGVYSPASHAFHYHVRVPVNGSSYDVTNQAGEKVPFDVVPVSENTKNIRRNRGDAKNELWITAKTDGFDFATFNVKESSGNDVITPLTGDSNMIENEYYKISFGSKGLESINGMAITNELLYFNSSQGYGQNSGAYIFRPNKTDPFIINDKPSVEITKGSSVEFATVTWGSWASQVYRLWKGENTVEVEWSVGPIPVEQKCPWDSKQTCKWGKEVISRYQTAVKSADSQGRPTVWTDTSGRNKLLRTKDHRACFDLNTTDAETGVAGNYYPINSRIAIEDDSNLFSVLVDRAEAGGSMKEGSIDLMVHRRITVDDHRGVDEPLMEPGQFGDGLMVRGRHFLFLGKSGSLDDKPMEEKILMKPQVFLYPGQIFQTKSSPLLTKTLDPQIKIILVSKHFGMYNNDREVIIRIEHLYQVADKAGNDVDIELTHFLANFEAHRAIEFMAGGDVPIDHFERFSWSTGELHAKKSEKSTCELENLCLRVSPGDLKTVVLEGHWNHY